MKIVIADDHYLIADGFINAIAARVPEAICLSASSLADLRNVLSEEQPSILFQDIRFGKHDAREFIKEILETYPQMKIIIISSLDDSFTIRTLLNQGVHGYLLKSDSVKEISFAIQTVMEGEKYISPEIKRLYSERELLFDNPVKLTPREKEVLQMISDERSTKQIALDLCLSEKSIENYRSRLLLKFGAKNVAGLIKKALLEGFI